MKVRCVSKNRDQKGRIVNYTLQFEDGRVIQATNNEIKNEMSVGRYQFTNLQIDKAGKLVDKAEEKQPEQSKQKPVAEESNFYTIEDLIRGNNPKGRKFRCYHEKTGKAYIGEGVCFHMGGDGNLGYTCIRVYIEELEREMTVTKKVFKNVDDFYAGYRAIVGEGLINTTDKNVIDQVVDYYNQRLKSHDIRLVFDNHGYRVDAKPNPAGRYTVVAIGKPKDSRLYKIRDNREGKEYWKSIEDLDYSPESNEFTNIAVVRNIRKFAKNIPEVEVGEVLKKKDACINKIKQEIRKNLQSSGITVTEDEVMVGDFKSFDETCKKVKKLWDTLELEDSFKDMLFEAVEEITDYEEHPQTLYYGYLDGMEETYYSYDPEDVKRSLGAIIQDCIHSMGEDCTELEAKRRVYDLVRTNINHDFVIDDDEEDWDED